MRGVALRVAVRLVLVGAGAIPEQAERVVVAAALREHLRLVGVVALVVAQDADAAAEAAARAEARALRAAQPRAALERVGDAAGDIAVVAAPIPEKPGAARQAEAFAPRLDAVGVVAFEIDERAEAESRRAEPEVLRRVAVVAGEIEQQGNPRYGGAEPAALQVVAVVARQLDDRRERADRDVAALVAVVAGEVDDHRHRAAARRRALVHVVAARVDNERRARPVPVVAARGDHHRADRRLEAAGLQRNIAHARGEARRRFDEKRVGLLDAHIAKREEMGGRGQALGERAQQRIVVPWPDAGAQQPLRFGQLREVFLQ